MNQTTQEDIKKSKSISLCLAYYVVLILYFGINIVLQSLFTTVIQDTSYFLYIFLVIAVPVILIILPVILKLATKKTLGESAITSAIIFMAYVLINFGLYFSIKSYFSDFSTEKWNTFKNHRYLMIDDLEKKYNLIGMNIEDVEDILGNSLNEICEEDKSTLTYHIQSNPLSEKYYVIYYENDIVTETDTYRDFEYRNIDIE